MTYLLPQLNWTENQVWLVNNLPALSSIAIKTLWVLIFGWSFWITYSPCPTKGLAEVSLLDHVYCCFQVKCPQTILSTFLSKYFLTFSCVKPGHLQNHPFYIALYNLETTGKKKTVWYNSINSFCITAVVNVTCIEIICLHNFCLLWVE